MAKPTAVNEKKVELLIYVSKIIEFELWSEDMIQDYWQGDEHALLELFIRGKPELPLDSHNIIETMRALYDIADAGYHCDSTFIRHLKK